MEIKKILSNFKIEQLNAMQESALKAISAAGDVVLISPTGTGKTLAYLLPLVPFIENNGKVQVLIIVPTRELALQIEQVFKQMGTGFKITCCYGGHSTQIEKNNLSEVPAVLLGTPGRLSHHIRKKNIDLSTSRIIVLDEFDKSLEAGFGDEMSFILSQVKRPEKKVLTSATELKDLPPFIKLNSPAFLDFQSAGANEKLEYRMVRVVDDDKAEALVLLLGKLKGTVLVFCNHREAVARLSDHCKKLKISHGIYHGGLDQLERQKTLIRLRNGSTKILITTDLAARGLDIPGIGTVVHYQIPDTEDVMIHRNGRTARMNASGVVYFLLDHEEYIPPFLQEKPTEEKLPGKQQIPEPPEWTTLYISAGKKDKVNKMDIVGMLHQKGKLEKDDLGKIEVLDHAAYAAIRSDKILKTLKLIKEEKVKNKKVKIEISN